MPYIRQEDRIYFDDEDMERLETSDPGQLNYVITKMVHRFLGKTPRYEDFNAAIGVLESAKLELYRRKVAPYEDKKIEENGDV